VFNSVDKLHAHLILLADIAVLACIAGSIVASGARIDTFLVERIQEL
jgi:hypothetical protein